MVALSIMTWLLLLSVVRTEYVKGKVFDRFVTIWLENQDFFKVSTNPDFTKLAQEGVLLTSYYGLTHPSQPNYMGSVAGDYFGLDNDDVVTLPSNVSTIVDIFDTKGISWKEYLEHIPSPGFLGADSGRYFRKHNPLASFDSVTNNDTRLSLILSLDDFYKDLNASNLPQWMHISPDILNDGHDTGIPYSANWTRAFLDPLLQSQYFMNNTLILLTYDEAGTYSQPNKIFSLLMGGAIPTSMKGTTDDTFYTHYSVLSTLENNWALPCLGRYDIGANVFNVVSQMTSYKNNKYDISSVDLSVSYPGYLNGDSKKYLPIPQPNILLTGAGGEGVLDSIKSLWPNSQTQTPYDGSGKVFDGNNPPVYVIEVVNQNLTTTTTSSSKPTKANVASNLRFSHLLVTAALSLFLFTMTLA